MTRQPRTPEEVLGDLEDGMEPLIEQARALLTKLRDQADSYEGALEALEGGVWGMRPNKIEVNEWAMLMPFVQAARIDSVRKALRALEEPGA